MEKVKKSSSVVSISQMTEKGYKLLMIMLSKIVSSILISIIPAGIFWLLIFDINKEFIAGLSPFILNNSYWFVFLPVLTIVFLVNIFVFILKHRDKRRNVNREYISGEQLVDILSSNIINAFFEAFAIYISIFITVFLLFLVPSVREIMINIIVSILSSILYSSESLTVIQDKVTMLNTRVDEMFNYISMWWNKYDYTVCYVLAYFDGVFTDFGLSSVKKKVLKLWEFITGKLF